jgi:preprotein translocase subunit SecD
MKKQKFRLLIILATVIFSLVVNMPKELNLNFSVGGVNVTRTIYRPQFKFGTFERGLDILAGLDIKGGTRVIYKANMDSIAEADRANALESARKVIEQRVNFFGVSEPLVQTSINGDVFRVSVEMPGVTNANQVISLIGQTARLDFRKMKDTVASSSAELFIPSLSSTDPTGVTGADMERFQISFNTQDGSPAVGFQTTSEGRDKFATVTRELVGKPLIAFLDTLPISIATVQQEIVGDGQITGNFTIKEAKNLVSLFNAGALPVPLELVEQENVGASLGQDSVNKSIRGGLVGLGAVMLFMILYYGKLGIISSLCLLIYGLVTLVLYRIIPVTLTLPGIAGFILSVGMAVDSNILIFERMKEELRAGKPWNVAMELGFGRAWESIKDANLATIITTFILFLGILVSLFTGIFVTRTLMRAFFYKKR